MPPPCTREDKRRTSRASANLKMGTLDLILREMLEVRVLVAIHLVNAAQGAACRNGTEHSQSPWGLSPGVPRPHWKRYHEQHKVRSGSQTR